MVYKICNDCRFTMGAKYCCISDFSRKKVYQIEKELASHIQNYENSDLKCLLDKVNKSERNIILDLINLEILLKVSKYLVPEKSIDTYSLPTGVVSNCIMDFDRIHYPYKKVLSELNDIGFIHLQLRFYSVNVSYIDILQNILDNDLHFKSVELYINDSSLSPTKCKEVLNTYRFIGLMIVFDNNYKECSSLNMNDYGKIFFTEREMTSENCCGNITSDGFGINITTYLEGKNYNSCLNGKLSIDKFGDIRNCPSMPSEFGNISSIALADVLKNENFYSYWKVTKDAVSICQDCEFRYICIDCRAYCEEPKNEDKNVFYGKPLKCSYNPYIGVWS